MQHLCDLAPQPALLALAFSNPTGEICFQHETCFFSLDLLDKRGSVRIKSNVFNRLAVDTGIQWDGFPQRSMKTVFKPFSFLRVSALAFGRQKTFKAASILINFRTH
jgi:hypothetical protein